MELTVASGLVSLPVDEIIGSSYREARTMLEELGLTADRITRTSGSQAGLVLDIQETSDRVEVGSTVTLVVSIAKKSQAESDPHAHEDAQAQADEDEDSAAAGGRRWRRSRLHADDPERHRSAECP